MNLRGIANEDLSFTLQDGNSGFGMPVIIDDGTHRIGDDTESPFYCQIGRVPFFEDPDTGIGVNGTFCHIAANLKDLKTAGFVIDGRNLSDPGWKVSAPDIDGTIQSYTIKSFQPDYTLGILLLICTELNRDNSVDEAILTQILENMGLV